MGFRSITCTVYCLALLFGLIPGSSFVVGTRNVLDLLKIVRQTNYSLRYVPGSESHMSAILFEDSDRVLELPENITNNVLMLLRNNAEFTFLSTFRQYPDNTGSLISISAGQLRLLEIESDSRREELHIHYPLDQHKHTETFPLAITSGDWHQLALTFNGNNITIYINCTKPYRRVLPSFNKQYLAGSKLSIFIGQRNQNSLHFKGAIQDLKFVIGQQGYTIQCPQISELTTLCPNCAQPSVSQQNNMNALYETFSKINLEGDYLREVIDRCKCMESCPDRNSTWEKDECTLCVCKNDSIECRYNDECKKTCFVKNKYYKHNEVICPGKTGEFCTCDAGFLNCEVCPPLDDQCDVSEQVQGDGCCPVCKGKGFCATGNDCPANSTCIDQQTKYTCLCNSGFHRNGALCVDIDECTQIGGPKGHHCSRDKMCVNTIGSYKCMCKPGLKSDGDSTCLPQHVSSGQSALVHVTCLDIWTYRICVFIWMCLFVHHSLR